MDTLSGYTASLCAGDIGTYLSQFLKPKIKILYWQSHNFMYTIPNNQLNPVPNTAPALPGPPGNVAAPPSAPANFLLLTQSLTIQNFGRESATWVEIVHARSPDFFQLYPALIYTVNTSPTYDHT